METQLLQNHHAQRNVLAEASIGAGRRDLDESTRKLFLDTFWHEQGWLRGEPGSESAVRLRASWIDPGIRREAVRLLVALVGDPLRVTFDDFRFNRMSGLITRYYDNSPWKALNDAGYQIQPFEMGHIPVGYFESLENRKIAMRWLVKVSNKGIEEITAEDFRANGIGRVLDYYNGSPYLALCEIGHPTRPERRNYAPQRTFDTPEKRRAIVAALVTEVEAEGRSAEEINVRDFRKRNLSSMLKVHFGNNPKRAVKESRGESK